MRMNKKGKSKPNQTKTFPPPKTKSDKKENRKTVTLNIKVTITTNGKVYSVSHKGPFCYRNSLKSISLWTQ